MQFTIENMKQIVTPRSSQETVGDPRGPEGLVMVLSSTPIDVTVCQSQQDVIARAREIACRWGIPIEELVRGNHLAVFPTAPMRLTVTAPSVEVGYAG